MRRLPKPQQLLHRSIFGYSPLSKQTRSTIVTLLVPHARHTPPVSVGGLSVKIDGEEVSVQLGEWGVPHGGAPAPTGVHFSVGSGEWSVASE